MTDPEVILSVLSRVPERWDTLEKDDLTAVEEDALGLLMRGGLVEVRVPLEFHLDGHTERLSCTIQATGETGWRKGLDPIFGELTSHWESVFTKNNRPPIRVIQSDAWRWRLSRHGADAQANVANGDKDEVEYLRHFLTRRKIINGNPPVFIGVEHLGSGDSWEPIDGKVQVLERSWNSTDEPGSGGLEIDWEEGADVIISRLLKQVPWLAEKGAKPKTQGRPPEVRQAVDQYLEDHALLQCRQEAKPTMDAWAAVIAEELTRFGIQKTTAGSVRQILKKRWAFNDLEKVDGGWTASPERL